MSVEIESDSPALELDDIELGEIELGEIDLDESLLDEAFKAEGLDNPDKSGSNHASDEGIFASGEAEATASLLIDGIELIAQTFGHEECGLTEDKKSLFITSYGRLLEKHQTKAPSFLLNWKEEAFALVITLVVCGSLFYNVKALKERDALALEDGSEHGKKS